MNSVEETLRIQATMMLDKNGEEDYQDFDLQLVFYPKASEVDGPMVRFFAVHDELFFLPLDEFIKLFNRALAIWEPFQSMGGTQ